MAKQKKSVKAHVPRKKKMVLRGRGDYDLTGVPEHPALAPLVSAVKSLDARVARSEAKASSGGAYETLAKDVGSFLPAGFGGLLSKLGRGVDTLKGMGDYEITSNSLMPNAKNTMSNGVPVFGKDGRRAIRVTEREYIGDVLANGTVVSSATAFNNVGYRINPGLSGTFPWLSTVAQQFEDYEMLGCVFEFVSTSSEYNGSSQALGTVIMATDYDPVDSNFTSKIQMENEDYANSTKASESAIHGVECNPRERASRVYKIRSAAVPSGAVIGDYDIGNFQIATQGMSVSGVNLGELWVSYDILFYKKNLYGGQLGNNVLSCIIGASTGLTTSQYFGTDTVVYGSLYVIPGATTLTFPRWLQTGKYQLIILWGGTNSAATAPTVTFTTNCSALANISGGGNGTDTSNGTVNNVFLRCSFQITGPSAVITLSGGTLPTSPTNLRAFILQENGAAPFTAITSDTG